MKFYLFVILFFNTVGVSLAEETNKIYITGSLMGLGGDKKTAALDAAKKSRESLPAEYFTEGNWGPVNGGIQISLRLSTNKISPGEPIVATILIRNVTDKTVSYEGAFANQEGPIRIQVCDDHNRILFPNPREESIIFSTRESQIEPETQQKWTIHLERVYDFRSNGVYSVYARLKNSPSDIESARLKLEVVKASSIK